MALVRSDHLQLESRHADRLLDVRNGRFLDVELTCRALLRSFDTICVVQESGHLFETIGGELPEHQFLSQNKKEPVTHIEEFRGLLW
jgi:hypothetical protein